MNVEYIKDYKYKELKQYVLAYLLIAVASVGFYVKDTIGAVGLLSALFQYDCNRYLGRGNLCISVHLE